MSTTNNSTPSVLLIGGPDAGKSNFLFRLWLAVDDGAGALVKDGFPDELEYLRQGLESLLKGEFAGRTSKEVLEHVTIPVRSASDATKTGVLSVPDVPGERVLRVYRSRHWDSLWEERIQEGCGCLVFIRAGSSEIVSPLDYAECLRLYGSALKDEARDASQLATEMAESEEPAAVLNPETEHAENRDDGIRDVRSVPIEPPTDVVLTDWLQFLRRAFTDKVSGAYRPRIGIVVAAWDGVQKDMLDQPPIEYLAQNFPLLWQIVDTNEDRFDFQVFGLSILGGNLKADKEFKETFVKGKPNEFGYVIHSMNGKRERVNDVTILVAWALGWFQPTLKPENQA